MSHWYGHLFDDLPHNQLAIRKKPPGLQDQSVSKKKRGEYFDIIGDSVIPSLIIRMCLYRPYEKLGTSSTCAEPYPVVSAGACDNRHQVVDQTVIHGYLVSFFLHAHDIMSGHHRPHPLDQTET